MEKAVRSRAASQGTLHPARSHKRAGTSWLQKQMPAGDIGGAEGQATRATQDVEAAGGPGEGAGAAPPPQERAASSTQAAPHEVRSGLYPALGPPAHHVHTAMPVCGTPCLPNPRGIFEDCW